jgi:phosphate acetyltransferase
VLINRVEAPRRAAVQEQLKQALGDSFPAYVLPERPLLEHPTVREIARALDAEFIGGMSNLLDGEVKCFKIGAMELPHFLEQIEDGSLIITPGDRSDIIIGAIAADMARVCPRIAGIVLTGGIKPPQTVQRVMNGLGASPPPVMSVETGTFLTASKIASVRPAFDAENERKITAVVGMVESSVDVSELLRRVAVSRSDRVTPLMFQHELIQRAKSKRRHIVLAEGTEERILRAAEIVLLRDVCDITLLGKTADVTQKISSLGLSLEKANILDPATSDLRGRFCDAYFDARKHKGLSKEVACDTIGDVSYFGTMMVHLGIADGMVSGAVHTTAHTIRPALEFVRTKRGISIVSSVFFMCLADRVLVYGDCAVNPDPTAAQLADIAISSAGTAAAFGIEPRVAMLSYSTGESGSGPDVDKVREATNIARERRRDLKIEGPIQYDAAVDTTVAKVKLPKSEVAGHATVLIFPDLNTGNNAYKAVQRAAGAIAIGPVLQGLNKPVNDLSRGALVADIVNTIAITAIQAQA